MIPLSLVALTAHHTPTLM